MGKWPIFIAYPKSERFLESSLPERDRFTLTRARPSIISCYPFRINIQMGFAVGISGSPAAWGLSTDVCGVVRAPLSVSSTLCRYVSCSVFRTSSKLGCMASIQNRFRAAVLGHQLYHPCEGNEQAESDQMHGKRGRTRQNQQSGCIIKVLLV